MRIDINTHDCLEYGATLNGKRLDYCVMADDELGIVYLLEQHWETGEVIPDETSPYNGCKYLEVSGKVEIWKVRLGVLGEIYEYLPME